MRLGFHWPLLARWYLSSLHSIFPQSPPSFVLSSFHLACSIIFLDIPSSSSSLSLPSSPSLCNVMSSSPSPFTPFSLPSLITSSSLSLLFSTHLSPLHLILCPPFPILLLHHPFISLPPPHLLFFSHPSLLPTPLPLSKHPSSFPNSLRPPYLQIFHSFFITHLLLLSLYLPPPHSHCPIFPHHLPFPLLLSFLLRSPSLPFSSSSI